MSAACETVPAATSYISNYPDKQKIRSALTLRNIIWLIWKTIFLLGILHLQINAYHFRQATGIRSIELETLYAGADTDKDGYFIRKKIKGFQRSLIHRFYYKQNYTALRPDEFLAQRGGDCEYWALMTCGLLRFWGWNGYVGAFYPPSGGDGHALCLVCWNERPGSLGYHYLSSGSTSNGQPVRPGYYVPIDYETVGGITTAMRRNWNLEQIAIPEKIYGQVM